MSSLLESIYRYSRLWVMASRLRLLPGLAALS